MKILKIFKKPVFLVTLVVLAAILSVSVIAATGAGSDFGGTVTRYQVGLQGKVNLKLFLDDATNGGAMADEDYYEVKVDGRKEEALKYPVGEIKTENVILVKLAPTEMSKTVTVTAVKDNGNTTGKVQTFCVKDYADAVLASTSENNKGHHDAMRALLNWGSKSEAYFTTQGNTADGLFSRGTDPISAVGADTIFPSNHVRPGIKTDSARFVSNDTKQGSELNLLLNEGNVSLVFKFYSNITDEDSLNATIKRNDWNEAKAVKAVKDGDHYVVRINSISTKLFNKTYTVTVTDGENNSVTATSSVLEYLDQIVEGKATNPSENQKNVAKSLYQLYQLTADNAKPDSKTCDHGGVYRAANFFRIPAGENTNCLKCAKCFAQIGGELSNNVGLYLTPELLKNAKPSENEMKATTVSQDGTFVRFSNFHSHEEGDAYFSYDIVNHLEYHNNAGRYLVMKIRVPQTDHFDPTYLQMYVAAETGNVGAVPAWVNGGISVKLADDGAWHTIVIDLAKRVANAAAYPEKEGKYNLSTLQIRPFDAHQSQFIGENVATYTDIATDIAYIAVVDNLADTKAFITDDTFELSLDKNTSASMNTADYTCIEHTWAYGSTTNEDGSKTYALTCGACGGVAKGSVTVPAGVAKYGTPDWITDLKLFTGSGRDKKTALENGVYYASIKGTQEIAWARGYADSLLQHTFSQENPIDIGNSNYMVIKIKSDKALDLSMTYSTQGANAGDYVEFTSLDDAVTKGLTGIKAWDGFYDHNTGKGYRINNKAKDGKIYTDNTYQTEVTDVTFKVAKTSNGRATFILPLATEAVTTGEWHVFVIKLDDLSRGNQKAHLKAEGADTYVVDFLYGLSSDTTDIKFKDRTLDIAYLAFAKDWEDIDGLVEEKTVLKLTDQKGGYVEVNANGTDISESGE